jgi:hypothetical protein
VEAVEHVGEDLRGEFFGILGREGAHMNEWAPCLRRKTGSFRHRFSECVRNFDPVLRDTARDSGFPQKLAVLLVERLRASFEREGMRKKKPLFQRGGCATSQAEGSAAQPGEEAGAVGSIQIENNLKARGSEFPEAWPVLPGFGAFGETWITPHAVNPGSNLEKCDDVFGYHHMEFGGRPCLADGPECWEQVDGVPEKAEVEDEDFPGMLG